jgi:ABC-2 type transport system ATP-binding protein
MEETAGHVLVIGRGRLLADMTMAEFTAMGPGTHVRVVTPEPARLRELLAAAGATVTADLEGTVLRPDRPAAPPSAVLRVVGLDNVEIAEHAARADICIHELTPQHASLEATFMELTHDSVEYRTGAPR